MDRTADLDADLHTRLERTWRQPRGLLGVLTAADHKIVGRRYILTGFAWFLLAGLLAGLMRMQLSRPENHLLGPDLYNQIFTMHGSTMMFLFAVPIMEAFAVYFVPLMVGSRQIAFPRLNAYSYWMYLAGGLFLWIGFALNIGPDVGWFAYVPLSGPEYTPGKRADWWAQMITFTEVAAIAVSAEIVVTVFKQRAPGMSLNRMPLFVWGQLVTAFMVLFAMPGVILASSFLISDRLVNTHFFNPAEGGHPLLWQHLFWFFGHPEVYIIFIPALGMVSEIVSTFARRPVFGYTVMVLSLIATAFMGFGLWVHHMFATGIPQLGAGFFTAASMMIAIPSGIQIFCWIATLWNGRPVYKSPLLFVIGFIVIFVIGGLSGVMVASVPFDLQVHDSYFVVAHFHYVLIGGAVFPLLGAVIYWFPKVTGRMMSETLAVISFWLLFVGFNITFFPMHLLGFAGMPRRVYTYPAGLGWDGYNLLASCGAVVLVLGFLLFLVNAVLSLRRGAPAGDNPWDAPTLEWATSSPPPIYNFLHVPVVSGREALWTDRGESEIVVGLRSDIREVLITGPLDAEPDHKVEFPGPSIWPFVTALATTALFVGSVFTPWAIPIGAVPVGVALTLWLWPKRTDEDEVAPRPPVRQEALAAGE